MNNDQGRLPGGLALGTIIVFSAMVLGTCLLVVFLYNLPVIFPPPGGRAQGLNATATPPSAALLITPAPSPLRPTLLPTLPASPVPTALAPSVPATRSPALPSAPLQGRIVFVTERAGFNSIYIMKADGSDQRPLVPHQGNYYDYAPAVSPDGRRVAFSSNRELIPNGAWPAWSPDGTHLAFGSDVNGTMNLYVYDFTTGAIQRLTDSRAAAYTPVWMR